MLGLATDVDRAHGNQAADDDLCAPQGCHETGAQQGCLRLDVEDVPAELAQVSVVTGVHEHPCHPEVVTLDQAESVGQDGAGDRGHHGDVRVDLSCQGVETCRRHGVHDGEHALVLGCLDLGPCQVLGALDEVEPTLLDLRERDLGVRCDLEEREDDPAGLGHADDVLAFLTDDERRHIRVLVVDGKCTIGELLNEEGLATDRAVVAPGTEGLRHACSQLGTARGGLDVLTDDALLDFVTHGCFAFHDVVLPYRR